MISGRNYTDRRVDDLAMHVDKLRAADVEAVRDARDALDRRLDGMNEFRQQLTDQARTFVPRVEAEGQWRRNGERLDGMAAEHRSFVGRAEHDALAERIGSLDVRLTRQEGTDVGSQSRTASLRQTVIISVAVLGLVITAAVAILDHFVSR